MPFFEWDNSLSVGVAKIDIQHKRLIQLINNFHDAMAEGKGKEMIGRTLNELVLYIDTHFGMEEELMTTHSYEEYEQHKAEHDKLTADVKRFQSDFKEGQAIATVEVMNFLRKWLTNHINIIDKKLAKFLREKGLQ